VTQPTPTWRALADRLAAALTVCCRCQIRHGVVVEKCTPCKRLDEYREAVRAEGEIVQTPLTAAAVANREGKKDE
jgi:hypothetical protein